LITSWHSGGVLRINTFVLRTNHTFVLRINLVVLRITTRGVLSVIFDSLQVSIDPRHARCPNLNPFDPGRFPYFPDGSEHHIAMTFGFLGGYRVDRPATNALRAMSNISWIKRTVLVLRRNASTEPEPPSLKEQWYKDRMG
jgi:hypothetical protein